MARLQVADGGYGLQIWRVAANILNKQSRIADKGWFSSLGLTTLCRKNKRVNEKSQEASVLDGFFGYGLD
jgi:hypothetical protein